MSEVSAIALDALRLAGDTTPLRDWQPVGGGMISQAARVRSERDEYLLKWGGQGLPSFFAAEARGLALLGATGALRVPAVLAHYDAPTNDDRPPTTDEGNFIANEGASSIARPHSSSVLGPSSAGYILLEWLPSAPDAERGAAFAALGRGLAALHRATAPAYGLDHDNYLGVMPQANGWMAGWAGFFRERRLRVQGDLARDKGHLTSARARRLEKLLGRLDDLLGGHAPPPALQHGDLWGGNVLIGPGGAPALIDPAVWYGDRETDLAYTALFGGFPETFYHSYQEVWPLPDGWRERREIYNLYHLLNHLNHFGESYGEAVDAILKRYGG